MATVNIQLELSHAPFSGGIHIVWPELVVILFLRPHSISVLVWSKFGTRVVNADIFKIPCKNQLKRHSATVIKVLINMHEQLHS